MLYHQVDQLEEVLPKAQGPIGAKGAKQMQFMTDELFGSLWQSNSLKPFGSVVRRPCCLHPRRLSRLCLFDRIRSQPSSIWQVHRRRDRKLASRMHVHGVTSE